MKSKLLVIVCTLVMALAVMAQSATQTTLHSSGDQMACCGQGAACCAKDAACCEGGSYGQGTDTGSGPMVSKNQDSKMACCGQGAACCTDGNSCCDGMNHGRNTGA